ncbi:MAG TPA: hypothetical protein VE111_20465 [Bradyrhizobium sp.]|nr:hypothetical protein [Bradyrhizobium sp.]
MKLVKQLRKQAMAAERMATKAMDSFAADEMRNLAEAFRVQAEILEKKKKKKNRSTVSARDPAGSKMHSATK